MNLYAYAGNDPISYADPFGDSLRFTGADKDKLADAYHRAKNILSAAAGNGDKGAAEALKGLNAIEADTAMYTVTTVPSDNIKWGSSYDDDTKTVQVNTDLLNGKIPNNWFYAPGEIVHELGHAFADNMSAWGGVLGDNMAKTWENGIRRPLHFCERSMASEREIPLHKCSENAR